MADQKYSRIVLKLSGETLATESNVVDPEVCDYLAREIKSLIDSNVGVAIVLGGGNIFRWKSVHGKKFDRMTSDYNGMLATVINSLSLGDILSKIGVENRVLSAIDMPKVCEPYIRNRALKHMEKGRVVIIGAGSGNPCFSTDTAAVIRATELDCQAVLKATKVDGVYTADPAKDKTAKKIDKLSYLDVLNNGYNVMDSTAVTLCMDNHIPILVFELMKKGNIRKVVLGKEVGTTIS